MILGLIIFEVWNGQNLASETKNDITTAYTYDPTGIVMSNDGTDTVRFIKNPHGNVVSTSNNDKMIILQKQVIVTLLKLNEII